MKYGMVILFFTLQLMNVVLSTMRSILTVKASRKAAALINAISYTFYNVIVKLITSQEIYIIASVTFMTNIIGVYIANWILDKFKKDKLWRISATIKNVNLEEVTRKLTEKNIQYNTTSCGGNKNIVDIFSYSQGESAMIKEVLSLVNAKYCVIEISKKL